MSNIFDYMNWRDIDIKKVEFNEIDNLILARVSYFPLDGLIKEAGAKLKEAYINLKNKEDLNIYLQKEDKDFFKILAQSTRFGDLIMSNYENHIDKEKEKQFAAVTILLPYDVLYVSFRGTDNTIVGWKEDFNMSFQDLVPSQIEAVTYLEKIAEKYPKRQIIVGGHSKGGNLAVYAAAFCNSKCKNRIIDVYNNDGPGFQENVIKSIEYKEILNKIHTYRPQTSIIGKLLNHEEKYITLKSTETGIMQHDLYSWQVLGDKFVRDEFTNSSEFIDQTISNWIKEVTPKQREQFVSVLFEVLNSTQAETLSEISGKWFANAKTMIKSYKELDENSKKALNKAVSIFVKVGKDNFKENAKNDILKQTN